VLRRDHPFGGEARIAPERRVVRRDGRGEVGKRVAAVVKMAPKDAEILQPMKDVGVDTYLIPSEETTFSRVIHESATWTSAADSCQVGRFDRYL